METHKTKTVLLFILFAVLCLVLFTFVACNDTPNPTSSSVPSDSSPSDTPSTPSDNTHHDILPHTHNHILTQEIPATCTVDGCKTYACSCGDVCVETTPALGHDMQWSFVEGADEHCKQCTRCDHKTDVGVHSFDTVVSVSKTPTCTQEGEQTLRCQCGMTILQSIPTNHKFTVQNKDAVSHWTECEVCHARDENTVVTHTFDLTVSQTPSTCIVAGNKVTQCICGAQSTQQLDLADHKYTQLNHNETHHWKECEVCHARDESTVVTHTFDLTVSQTPSTCIVAGNKVTQCICGAQSTQSLDLADHKYTQLNHNETHHWTECEVCHAHDESTVMAHTFDLTVSQTTSTCTVAGSKLTQCSCGAQSTQSLDLAEHKYTQLNHNETHHWKECEVCHARDESTVMAHTFDLTVSQTPSTCTVAGNKVTQCICGAQRTQTLDLAEHKYTQLNHNETHHWTECEVCQTVESGSKNVHKWQTVSQTSATCNKYAYLTEECETCTESRTVIDEQGGFAEHDIDFVEKKLPTANENGWISHWVCSNCHLFFGTEDGEELLTEERIILSLDSPFTALSILELKNIAERDFKNECSNTLFQVTAKVRDVNIYGSIEIYDETGSIQLEIDDGKYDLDTIFEGDILAVSGYLSQQPNGTVLESAQIHSVDDGDENTATLEIKLTGDFGRAILSAESQGENYNIITLIGVSDILVYFNKLTVGAKLTFNFIDLSGRTNPTLIINGTTYSIKDTLTVTITGDMTCEFIF